MAHTDGNVVGWPHVVVEDGAERTDLFQPEGAPFFIWNLDEQRFSPQFTVRMYALRIVYPYRPYFVSLWFEGERAYHPGGSHTSAVTTPDASAAGRSTCACLTGAPRSASTPRMAFSTTSSSTPTYSWYIKDDENPSGFTAAGVYTEEEAARIREACSEPTTSTRRTRLLA